MKTLSLLAIALLLLNSCNFNKSINKNLNTGAISKGDGLSCDNITLTINEEAESRNTFVEGERITINFNDMKGFTKVGGKFYFGLSMEIKSKSGKVFAKTDDLFADNKGFDMDPITPMANLNAVFDDQMSADYTVKIKIWDKKGKGTFTYEMPYSVRKNEILTIRNNGLHSKIVTLVDLTKEFRVGKNEIKQADEFEIGFFDTKGFQSENGNSFISVSLRATDASGKVLLDSPNLFEDYRETGIPADKISEKISVKFNFGQGKIKNPVLIESVVSDLKSNKRLTLKTKMNLN